MRLNQPIDASKYDIRVLWSGLLDHVPPDAALVEGFPLDPPDDAPGWMLVEFRVEPGKEADRYCTLWVRKKRIVRARRAKAAQLAQEVAPKKERRAPGRPRRWPRKKKAQAEPTQETSTSTPS